MVLGTSLTSLSVNLISSIAQGGGFNVPEESYEEWTSERSPSNDDVPKIRVIKPLRDVGIERMLSVGLVEEFACCRKGETSNKRQAINRGLDRRYIALDRNDIKQGLTKLIEFIFGLEKNYPSTVSAIARTCAKVSPKDEAASRCVVCKRSASCHLV